MGFQPTEPIGSGDHVVAAGETLDLIALRSGHFAETIWNDPANAALKAARQERNVLLPGDRITIPALRPKEVPCVTGGLHRFRRKGVPSKIVFVVRTPGGRVFARVRYRLVVDGVAYEGETDDGGKIERFVAASTKSAELSVWPGVDGLPEILVWPLTVGTLLPVDSVAGMQQRLQRLGYACGNEGVLDDATREAISEFQDAEGFESTGEPDEATLARLLETAGC